MGTLRVVLSLEDLTAGGAVPSTAAPAAAASAAPSGQATPRQHPSDAAHGQALSYAQIQAAQPVAYAQHGGGGDALGSMTLHGGLHSLQHGTIAHAAAAPAEPAAAAAAAAAAVQAAVSAAGSRAASEAGAAQKSDAFRCAVHKSAEIDVEPLPLDAER